MLPQHVLLALISACAAVPLNINLGAYSPALVVGDGEISLGSAESASGLMATLASGAAEGQPQGQQEQQQQPPAEAPPAPPAEAQAQGEQNQEPPAEANAENAAKRDLSAVLKRSPANEHIDAISHAMEWIKRDLPGFNAALAYAREAMKDTPKIEMGSEGAGVGIVVNAGLNVPANSAANGQPPAGERKAKRDEVVAEEGEAPKMTLVAITEV